MNATWRTRPSMIWTSLAAVAIPFLMGADGDGCSGGKVADGGPGRTADAGTDASTACSASDCAGLAAPAIARLCPDGSSVAATMCVAQSDGQCGWGFPECPADDAGSDAAVICSCPNMPIAPTCPDGSPRGFMQGPAPCHCEELAPCPASDGGGPCAADADCPTDAICGFPEADACTATGRCFAVPGAHCEAYEAGCACGGSEINLACTGLPNGYSTKPLMHAGACEGGI